MEGVRAAQEEESKDLSKGLFGCGERGRVKQVVSLGEGAAIYKEEMQVKS